VAAPRLPSRLPFTTTEPMNAAGFTKSVAAMVRRSAGVAARAASRGSQAAPAPAPGSPAVAWPSPYSGSR
jgi:hypothetical protein